YGSPHWSRDGSAIYATRQKLVAPGGASIQEAVKIPLAGGPIEAMTALGRNVADVREGDDGRLYWSEATGHSMRLVRAPLADLAKVERLPLPVMSQFQ